LRYFVLVLFLIPVGNLSFSAEAPVVVATSPGQNELNVPAGTAISVTFDVDMDESTMTDTTFVVHGRCTGLHMGVLSYEGSSRTVLFEPFAGFAVGEVMTVVLTAGIRSLAGEPPERSYIWSFTVAVAGGAGTFAPYVDYAASHGDHYSVLAADLDADGDLDLVTANMNFSTIAVLWNRGDGVFTSDSLYLPLFWPVSLSAADLDHDGDLDLAVGGHPDQIAVLLNDGSGDFSFHWSCTVDYAPASVLAADLNGDGHLDLATCAIDSNTVSVLLNAGGAVFNGPFEYAVGDHPISVVAADLDNDGDVDLATANSNSRNVSVLLNQGDATFAPHTVYPVESMAYPYWGLAGDLDGDGDVDLATVSAAGVSVILNSGSGTFGSPLTYLADCSGWQCQAGDLDGDGDLDVVAPNSWDRSVSVLLNNGDGTLGPASFYPVGEYVANHSICAADLDSDGDLDLASGSDGGDKISVLFNQAGCCVRVAGNVDGSHDDAVDIGDLTYLIRYLLIPPPTPPACMEEANVDGDPGGVIDVGDLTALIDYLFISATPPAACQ